jgi:hypothetical protein
MSRLVTPLAAGALCLEIPGVRSACVGIDLAEVRPAPFGHRVGIDVELFEVLPLGGESVKFRLSGSDELLERVMDPVVADFAEAGVMLLARPDDRLALDRHCIFLSLGASTSSSVAEGEGPSSLSPEGL